MHPKRKVGTKQEQSDRAGKRQRPAARAVDQIANAGRAKPKFIMPLADPEYLGALSIGTAQIGPTMTSMEKKGAPARSLERWLALARL